MTATGRTGRRATPKPRGRYHHGDLREALVAAALAVVRREGIDAVKPSALAKRLKVSPGAPFRHFATREALLVAVAEDCAARMVTAMEAAAASHPHHPLEAQRARGVAYVRFIVEEPAALPLLSRPDIVAASPMLRAAGAAQAAAMEPILGQHRTGTVSPVLAQRAAGFLAAQCLTVGLAHMITSGLLGPVSPDDAERLAHELTGVLGEGLLPREDAPPQRR
jgi:AcrR family transcriptional regulator